VRPGPARPAASVGSDSNADVGHDDPKPVRVLHRHPKRPRRSGEQPDRL
ncbi:MAG: hypothetical protein AVDCRST_MAG72-1499, partial [uncultured Nocardioidaceae bacterium]